MSERIRLDAYLPVLIGGQVGFCQELSTEQLCVDLVDGLEVGALTVATLRCTDSLEV